MVTQQRMPKTVNLMFSSYVSEYTIYTRMAYWKETAMRVQSCILPFYILHLALTQKIDISDIKAVVGYVERLHTTCSFQVTSVSIHEMLYWKVLLMHDGIHNLAIKSHLQLKLTE